MDRATRSLPLFGEHGKWNDDGWGIAYYRDNRAVVKRKPEAADQSKEFEKTIYEARSKNMIAHVRRATQGDNCEENCHPFKERYRNRDLTFAHNGTFSSIPDHPESEGGTDSEHLFRYLIDCIQRYQTEGRIRGFYPGLVNGLEEIFEKFGNHHTLNFLLSDGSMYYVFSHYPGKPVYSLKREKEYGGVILLSTQELTDEEWDPIPENRVMAINNGEIVVLSDPISNG